MENVYVYTIKEDNTISLKRVYGNHPVLQIPSTIDGMIVSEIGAYCFSLNNKLKGNECYTESNLFGLSELCGNNIQSVVLPDGIIRIDSFAFYNCRKLKSITFSDSIKEIGSDVFLNCSSLHDIYVSCSYQKPTVLKYVLRQMSWDVEVHFLDEVTLLFPEYFEVYDVIGPAHVFGMNIEGEGYRCRQCFKNNCIQLEEYDSVFSKLSQEESVSTSCRFALNRLLYPKELNNELLYKSFIQQHSLDASLIVLKKEIDVFNQKSQLEKMIQNNYIDLDTMNVLIDYASKHEMVEILTYLIQWKKQYFIKKKTYDFEDF